LGTAESGAIALTHTWAYNLRSGPEAESVPDDSDGFRYASPPGSLPWGKSPYGVEDMSGNVAEWVADAFDLAGYDGLPARNPIRSPGSGGDSRVVRGGSWSTWRFVGLTYFRGESRAESRASDRGFRCAAGQP
jgi:formylglycine-generating enzyme required for sulfatase activity